MQTIFHVRSMLWSRLRLTERDFKLQCFIRNMILFGSDIGMVNKYFSAPKFRK